MYTVFTSHKEVFKELFLPSYQLVLLKYTVKANIDYPELFSQSIFYFQISKFLDLYIKLVPNYLIYTGIQQRSAKKKGENVRK